MMMLDQIKRRVGADHEPMIARATRTLEGLNRMADTLLDVSRLEEGKMPIERAPCDLTQMAHDVRLALGGLDPERSIGVEARELRGSRFWIELPLDSQ